MAQHAPNGQGTPSEGTSPTDIARLNPSAMSVADAARVFARLGGNEITEALLRGDIDAGAPTNHDGTINVVHYAAWLVKQAAESGGSRGDD